MENLEWKEFKTRCHGTYPLSPRTMIFSKVLFLCEMSMLETQNSRLIDRKNNLLLFLEDGKWKWKSRKQMVWPYERKGKFTIPLLGWWYEYPPLWGIAFFIFFPSFFSFLLLNDAGEYHVICKPKQRFLVTAEHYYI